MPRRSARNTKQLNQVSSAPPPLQKPTPQSPLPLDPKLTPAGPTSPDTIAASKTAPTQNTDPPKVQKCKICDKRYTSLSDPYSTTRGPRPETVLPDPPEEYAYIVGQIHTDTLGSKEFLYWSEGHLRYFWPTIEQVRETLQKAINATEYHGPLGPEGKTPSLTNLGCALAGPSFATSKPTVFLDDWDHEFAVAVLRFLRVHGMMSADGVLPNHDGFVVRLGMEYDMWEVQYKESNG